MNWLSRFAPQLQSVLRVVTGLLFLEHGTQKLFGFPPLPAAMAHMHVPAEFARIELTAGSIELVAGVLVTLGLFSRWAAFIASGEMAFAYWLGHAMFMKSLYPVTNLGDPAVLYCFVFLYLASAGPGPWAVNQR